MKNEFTEKLLHYYNCELVCYIYSSPQVLIELSRPPTPSPQERQPSRQVGMGAWKMSGALSFLTVSEA